MNNIDKLNINKKCCQNCEHFEERTKFCRLNPPQIAIINLGNEHRVQSYFSTIVKPQYDYCSYFTNKVLID